MKRLNALMVVGLVATTSASASKAQQVEYERYTLPNGMTVILHEDHSLPTACINTWYYVGSKDEADRRSGFAHLFEHLMFMGTERVPEGRFDQIMESYGGWNNASTSQDRTNYYSCGPAELLPVLLWLDADRLESLGKAMTQEKLDKQRDVVRNERRQSYENQPYAKAWLAVYEMMYPEEHPYHEPVIGTHEDLEAATVDDVKNFFATYYVPSNASLVVAGDFNKDDVKPLVEKLFGTLQRGSDVVHKSADPVELDGVMTRTLTDNVQFPRTMMVYHSPAEFQPGDAEMDLVADILADGISSRLYQRLIYKDKLASDVSAFQASGLLGSLFFIQATAAPGVTLDQVETAADEVIAEFLREGPTSEELERQKSRREFSFVSRLESLLARADALNKYQFFFDEPDSFKVDLDRYRTVSRNSAIMWARKVLTPDARLILRVVPELETPEVNPRDTQPSVAEGEHFDVPLPVEFKLSNGIPVYLWERPTLPLVDVRLMAKGGSSLDSPPKAGVTVLAAGMLDEGAGDRDAVAFEQALDELGASFSAWAGREDCNASMSVLRRNLEPALDLFADAVRRPRFDDKEWERVHRLHIEGLRKAMDRPGYIARFVAMREYFGEDHPYGMPTSGTPATAATISLADARAAYERIFRPSSAVILAAGDVSQDELKNMLEQRFGDWKEPSGAASPQEPAYPTLSPQPFRVVIVDRPEAVQTVINFVMPGPVYGNANRLKFELLGTILGGSFTSRLNQNLREEHGYTYGARSGYTMDRSVGYLSAGSDVFANVSGPAVGEFLKELRGIRNGDITADEARKARLSQRRSLIDAFEGLGGILGSGAEMLRYGRPFSAIGDDLAAVMRISEDDLNKLANSAVPLENALLVLVGDRKAIMEQLQGLDLPEPKVIEAKSLLN
ncbi:MAG: insulinase family protein [Phycisphaerae bacterium]|nr:insulinase family protein [Phycisphaerae bacterium]